MVLVLQVFLGGQGVLAFQWSRGVPSFQGVHFHPAHPSLQCCQEVHFYQVVQAVQVSQVSPQVQQSPGVLCPQVCRPCQVRPVYPVAPLLLSPLVLLEVQVVLGVQQVRADLPCQWDQHLPSHPEVQETLLIPQDQLVRADQEHLCHQEDHLDQEVLKVPVLHHCR